MKCAICDKVFTEGYVIEPESQEDVKRLRKRFPFITDKHHSLFVSEDCLYKNFSIALPNRSCSHCCILASKRVLAPFSSEKESSSRLGNRLGSYLVTKLLTAIERRGESVWEGFFLLFLRPAQVYPDHYKAGGIREPAIPDKTHSDENSRGKLANSQGHTVWKATLASTPPAKPNTAKIPSIFILSFITFTLLLTVKSSRF